MKMRYRDYSGNRENKTVGTFLGECLSELGIAEGLNSHKIFEAWNEISGAGRHTLGLSFRGGNLYVSLSSSVVRNELYPRVMSIREGINKTVASDPLFTRDASETEPVKKIILQ